MPILIKCRVIGTQNNLVIYSCFTGGAGKCFGEVLANDSLNYLPRLFQGFFDYKVFLRIFMDKDDFKYNCAAFIRCVWGKGCVDALTQNKGLSI